MQAALAVPQVEREAEKVGLVARDEIGKLRVPERVGHFRGDDFEVGAQPAPRDREAPRGERNIAGSGERGRRRDGQLDEAQLLHGAQCTVAFVFALTFDDGPGPSTAALLDVLQAAGVRATFFLLGRNVVEAPWCGDPARARALAVRAAREGHVLGNHTYSHFRPDRWRELRQDVLRGAEVVRDVRGAAGPLPFRLPYGVRLVEVTLPSPAGTLNTVTVDSAAARHRFPGPRAPALDERLRRLDHEGRRRPKLAAAMVAHVLQTEALGLDAVMDLHDSGTGSASGYERPATIEGVRLFLQEASNRHWRDFTVGNE